MDDQKWINRHPGIVIAATSVSLLICITAFVITVRHERSTNRHRGRRHARSHRTYEHYSAIDSNSAVMGRLVFEKIPLRIRERSGKARRFWKKGRTIRCGESLDVMWLRTDVLFMKEKGILDRVLVAGRGHFSDLEWDGRNVWVSNPDKGIFVLDTSGQILAEVDPDSGLPPGEKGLLMHTIEPGRMFVVGSCGPFSRGWCSIVEFKDGKASVNVFHQAKRVPTETDDKEEIQRDPFVVFKPTSIGEHVKEGHRIILIGRSKQRYLLQVDLATLGVTVASYRSMPSEPRRRGLEYDGKVYVPGRVWYCFDPDERRREDLVTRGRLPEPYCSLRSYWVSAHYGLVGWTPNQEFCQIRIIDEEHDIMAESPASKHEYYHTFAFEDANGSPFRLRGAYSVRFAIYRKNRRTLKYNYGPSSVRGYFPPGTYEVWATATDSWGKEVKVCECERLRVTEYSPERLVFKVRNYWPMVRVRPGWVRRGPRVGPKKEVRPRREILYCGQVVNAVTGRPMVGAFVMDEFDGNLAWITQEQWQELHKLPSNPALGDKALQPIKKTSPFKFRRIVRTGPDGRFEISFKSSYKPYSFIAFEENYFSTELRRSHYPPVKDGKVKLPSMALFPAAKIMIEPYVGCSNIWLDFIAEPNENSNQATTFFNMFGGYSSGPEVDRPRLKGQVRQPYHVPAGVRFKMKFSIPYEEKWCIPDIPQTVNLKQGEMLDLGRFVFDPAMKIFLKVIDSAGKPVVGVPIVRWFDDMSHNIRAQETDSSGKAAFYVEPNLEVKFTIYRDQKSWEILKTVTCEVGGREDEGKEFTVQL